MHDWFDFFIYFNKISRDFNYLLVVLFIVLVMRLNIPAKEDVVNKLKRKTVYYILKPLELFKKKYPDI